MRSWPGLNCRAVWRKLGPISRWSQVWIVVRPYPPFRGLTGYRLRMRHMPMMLSPFQSPISVHSPLRNLLFRPSICVSILLSITSNLPTLRTLCVHTTRYPKPVPKHRTSRVSWGRVAHTAQRAAPRWEKLWLGTWSWVCVFILQIFVPSGPTQLRISYQWPDGGRVLLTSACKKPTVAVHG